MNKEEIEFFETRIPILRRHYTLVSEINGQINEEETKGVKWIPISDLSIHCSEPYMVNTIYEKLNSKIINSL